MACFRQRYSMRQVADLIEVHLATVWRWHLRGVRGVRLRTILVGGRRFVLATDLANFLAMPSESIDGGDFNARAAVAGQALLGYGIKTS